ncbi:aconitate hydratase AcnA [Oleispirillum naphthae]|uniref:aconitate hydratase AcnA n=1 Tax=Oleispirillum naphthae TaxID=2838853 RepID=UPI0030824995
MPNPNSFNALKELEVGRRKLLHYSLKAAEQNGLPDVSRLPYSLKVLLENALRHEDNHAVTVADIVSLATWPRHRHPSGEIAFHPVRILMPDSSGLPLLADLAAMRDAMRALGGDPARINPVIPAHLVVDHSVNVDFAGSADALARNKKQEYQRNGERYGFLKWAEGSYRNFKVVPPGSGICHQINLEYLAQVVWTGRDADGRETACPDSLLGMDSHTPMVNSLGVFGWGVGGIEAAAALLGQPVSVAIPEVVGCRLVGKPRPGLTATDIVLTVTQVLRRMGVVQKFVEFWGDGVSHLSLTDRAPISNMAPEYGATMGFFPIDRQTIDFLALSGRDPEQIALVESYARAQGLWRDADTPEPVFSDVVEVDLSAIEPSMAGPRRPQDRVPLTQVSQTVAQTVAQFRGVDASAAFPPTAPESGAMAAISDGDIAIAAITSCTNSSNPSVVLAAGLIARNARARGLTAKPWVKTSLAPGSQVVAAYLERSGLQKPLDELGFQVVGFGCTTCLGNSGPLSAAVSREITEKDLMVAAVTSSNRNFEGRVHPQCRMAFLASPPLVVACAIAGTLRRDLLTEPLGADPEGKPVFLADIWPSPEEISEALRDAVTPDLYRRSYADVFDGGAEWDALSATGGVTFAWDPQSTYILQPPFFGETTPEPAKPVDIVGARPLLMLGDSITTDHISPVGAITPDSAAGRYLIDQGVEPADFNSFSGRRVNHHVMMRGGFANIRLKNEMAPGTEGGFTRLMPEGSVVDVYDAAAAYRAAGVPLVVVAGKEYGAGSSRDWAAKVTRLLGVRAVIAESFERIHRSNLICMGVLPLQFPEGVTRTTLGLTGCEVFDIAGLTEIRRPGGTLLCRIRRPGEAEGTVTLQVRLDTAYEVDYWRNGGILDYVLRGLFAS